MLRRGSEGKKPLKEKILLLYDAVFKGEDLALENPNFWDEFFLLKVNAEYLEKKFEALTSKELIGFTDDLNRFFSKCAEYIISDNVIRMINAVQTMTSLFRNVLTLDSGDTIKSVDLLIGYNSADVQMQLLLRSLTAILTNSPLSPYAEDEEEERIYPTELKTLVLKLILTILTGHDDINKNPFMEYVMLEEEIILCALIDMLADPVQRSRHGQDLVLFLTLLINYCKYDTINPYIMKLSVLDSELALHGLASVISSCLSAFNRQFVSKQEETKSSGLFSTITNMVGNMFIGDSDEQKQLIKSNEAVLLALYEAVHLNRNFISVLTHSHPDALIGTPPTTPKGGDGPGRASTPATPTADSAVYVDTTNNVLCTFIQYTSIIMQDTKVKQNISSAKLCFVILTCITEDQFANSFLHDDNMIFRIQIHRMPMRHRKIHATDDGRSRPLACWLFDLASEFLVSHMMKEFPFMQHMRCVGIIHRLMCYQKKYNVRLQYHWKELWSSLLFFLKFVVSNESNFIAQYRQGVFVLLTQVINLFNMFITFGDIFLPSPTSYDELYYEIIRMAQLFDNLHAVASRYMNHPEYKEFASRLKNSLFNIRAIIMHFRPKIDKWSKDNSVTSLTEQEVLDVVKENYDSLTLRLQDNLESYERYSEKPKNESVFFSDLVQSIVQSYRKNFVFDHLDLHKYSSIS